MKDKTFEKLYLYLMSFFIYSMFGWIYEVIIYLVNGHGFINRGFLFGPWLPVYGFGGLILLFCLQKLMKKKITTFKINIMPVIIFLLIVIITSIIEYLTSYFMEVIFNDRWWNYTNWALNINGRVALVPSLRFGVLGILVLYLFQPYIEKFSNKINIKAKKIIFYVLLIIIVLDTIFSICKLVL